jgi:hypothetical protein
VVPVGAAGAGADGLDSAVWRLLELSPFFRVAELIPPATMIGLEFNPFCKFAELMPSFRSCFGAGLAGLEDLSLMVFSDAVIA